MRQPPMHCIVALFLFGPGGAWQTRPGQHCESFVHFDWGSGPASLQPSAPAGTGATTSAVLATSTRRAVRQSDFASGMGRCTSGADAARIEAPGQGEMEDSVVKS
jgi:hypothetical protein